MTSPSSRLPEPNDSDFEIEIANEGVNPAIPFSGNETMLQGVQAMYPDLPRREQIQTADLSEAWVANGMMNGEYPAKAKVVDGYLEVEVLGLGQVHMPIDLDSYEGFEK